MRNVLVIGYTGSGKSTVAEAVSDYFDGARWYNVSDAIGWHVNPRDRGELAGGRAYLFGWAEGYCWDDPARLVRECLDGSSIVAGVRREVELACCWPLFDCVLWVDRPGVEKGETDFLEPDDADLVIVNDGLECDLAEKVAAALDDWRKRPYVMVFGRYRHYLSDGTWDLPRMLLERQAEHDVAVKLQGMGCRTWEPINRFFPLDDFWEPQEAGRQIVAMSLQKIRRAMDVLNIQPQDNRNHYFERAGWDDEPASVGTSAEVAAAKAVGMKPIKPFLTDDELRAYVLSLRGAE